MASAPPSQVVVGDGVDVRQVQVAPADRHGGDDLGHLGQRRPARLGADQHQPVDAEVGQGAGGRVVAGPVEAPAVEQQLAALLGERVGEAVEEVDEPRVAHVVEQRPDRATAALAQVPRGGVRPVAQLGDGALHGGPPVRADLRRPAQHERHQRLRHARPRGDGVDRRTIGVSRHGASALMERSSEHPRRPCRLRTLSLHSHPVDEMRSGQKGAKSASLDFRRAFRTLHSVGTIHRRFAMTGTAPTRMEYDPFSADVPGRPVPGLPVDARRGAGLLQREMELVGAVALRRRARGRARPRDVPVVRGHRHRRHGQGPERPGFLPNVDNPRHDQIRASCSRRCCRAGSPSAKASSAPPCAG